MRVYKIAILCTKTLYSNKDRALSKILGNKVFLSRFHPGRINAVGENLPLVTYTIRNNKLYNCIILDFSRTIKDQNCAI